MWIAGRSRSTRIWRIARPSRRRIAGYGSKIDPYAHLVDEWLEADRLLPRKQRHTIRRVHDRLLAETDYDGEYSTTMRYVHRWREANRGVPDREGYVRLEWAAGSMQVDFGVARARIAGEMADVHCLVVSLPYSNMRLCVALPGENAECLCHGLMLVFEPYRGCSSRDRDGQRDRCRPAQREGRGRVDRGVLRVRGALPARGPVLQPVFGQREGQRGERGRVFAAQSHGAAPCARNRMGS